MAPGRRAGRAPATFPPEPWTLVGRMLLSTFLVPEAGLPVTAWPPGSSPVRVGGRVPVGASWVVYEPGGLLDYRELLVAVLVRRGVRLMPHVVAIWVDSPASRDGGRALWGIPKELASFGGDDAAPSCTPEGATTPVARATVRARGRVPGRWPVGFTVVQTVSGRARPSPVHVRAGLGLAAADWEFDQAGELAFLVGRRPVVSASLHDFAMLFGLTATDRARQAGTA